MTWRIANWDPVRAEGTIVSTEIAPLRFDAAVALTDHFEIGEEVDVRLVRQGESYRVVEIAPVAWQRPRSEPATPQPSSMQDFDRALDDRGFDLRIEDGRMTLSLELRPHEAAESIELVGVSFVQMPLEGRFARVTQHPRATFQASAAVAASWPASTAAWVFRFEPEHFGEPAGYVVANGIRLVTGG